MKLSNHNMLDNQAYQDGRVEVDFAFVERNMHDISSDQVFYSLAFCRCEFVDIAIWRIFWDLLKVEKLVLYKQSTYVFRFLFPDIRMRDGNGLESHGLFTFSLTMAGGAAISMLVYTFGMITVCFGVLAALNAEKTCLVCSTAAWGINSLLYIYRRIGSSF